MNSKILLFAFFLSFAAAASPFTDRTVLAIDGGYPNRLYILNPDEPAEVLS